MTRKTKFQQNWLEKTDPNGDKLCDYIRPSTDEHRAICRICDKPIYTGHAGFSALRQHAEGEAHKSKANDFFRRSAQGTIQFRRIEEVKNIDFALLTVVQL